MQFSPTLLGLPFRSPLVTASGKWTWTCADWRAAAEAGAGGITTKSFWNHAHQGNPEPVVAEEGAWTLNAVGLPDHGPEHSSAELMQFLPKPPVPLIVSILGLTAAEYAENAARVAAHQPSALEVNLSSPTFLKLKGTFFDADEAVAIVPAVKAAAPGIPVFVKLSPNIPDIGAFAARCVDAGADGITAINTLGTGMSIDLATRRPVLSAQRGGLSGPGIKPLAVRCVADIYAATGGRVPIIGIGGMMSGRDVAEMLLAGASLVGLATAIHREGFAALGRIEAEFTSWAEEQGVSALPELIGGMHRS